MASALIKFVVSFSSQDEVHKVQNLINGNGCQKWLSHSKEKTGQIEAIFQLEDFLKIAFIDVATIWCSTIEIQVGRSDWPQDKQYPTLCPTASLMTPIDCRLKQNFNKTRMFSKEEFIDTVVREKWDRIKLILRQPYRKDVQFGLSLLKVKSAAVYIGKPKLRLSPLDDNGRVKMIKSHFFGSKKDREPEERLLKDKLLKLSSTSENGSSELTRTAKLVLAASETTNRSYSPSHRSKENNTTARRGLFSESVAQKSAPRLEDEIVKFLFDQKLTPEDLDIVTVADLRHRLEKIKKRKLNSDEKKVFMNYCQSYLVEILDGSIVSDINSGLNSGLDKQQTVDNFSTSNGKSSSGGTDQKASNTLSRDSSRTRKSSTDSLGQNCAKTLNTDTEDLISGRKSATKFPQKFNDRSTEDDCLERLLSQNSRLLKSAKYLTKSAVSNIENEIVSFGDFDICDISDDDSLGDISESNSGFSSSNDAQKRSVKTPNKQCIKSQIKNCVDVSSSKKKVMVNKTKTVTPSRSISANSGSLRNGETRNGKDIEIIDNASYGSIITTPKSSALSNLTHSGKKVSQSNSLQSPKSDNSPLTSARKRKRSEANVYIPEGQTFIGSGKKGQGRGKVGVNSRGKNNPDSEITDSCSKQGHGRGRGQGKGRGKKSSQDSPILVTDDVWLNIGGGQVLGSTPDRSESTGEDSVSRLLPCSICNVKIKDYLLDHHFIQCSARVYTSQIDIPPLPDLVPSLGARDTSGRGRKQSKSSSTKAMELISMCDNIYEKNDPIRNRATVNEHNSLGVKQEQNSFAVSSSPASEDVVVSDSEDDLELLISTLQDVLVQCPICSERFPTEIINVHTNACLDQGS